MWPVDIPVDRRKKAIIFDGNDTYEVPGDYATEGVSEGWLSLTGWHRENGSLVGRYILIDPLDFLSEFE